jgi:hypothetical protein
VIAANENATVHCAECQRALDGGRTGWCAECRTFVAAAECPWVPGRDGAAPADLSCPTCGWRWCCGLESTRPIRGAWRPAGS